MTKPKSQTFKRVIIIIIYLQILLTKTTSNNVKEFMYYFSIKKYN